MRRLKLNASAVVWNRQLLLAIIDRFVSGKQILDESIHNGWNLSIKFTGRLNQIVLCVFILANLVNSSQNNMPLNIICWSSIVSM